MSRVRLTLLVAVALLAPLAGCLDTLEGAVDRVRGTPPPPEDLAESYSGFVGPGHSGEHAFLVEEGARLVRVELSIDMDTGTPVPAPALAQVDFVLQDPDGAAVGEATLSASETEGLIELTNATSGRYTLAVSGNGLSNGERGAAYQAIVLVRY